MFAPKQIVELIDAHINHGARERTAWDKYHAWYLSEYWDNKTGDSNSFQPPSADTAEVSLETNYPYPYIDTMIANVCPTNPMLTIKARDPEQAESAKGREALVNDTFRRDKLHAKAWDLCIDGGLCGRALSKTVWDARRRMPTTSIIDPRTVFFDMTRQDWSQIRYICEAVVLTEDEFKARVRKEGDPPEAAKYDPILAEKHKPGAYPVWLEDKERSPSTVNDDSRRMFQWYTVFEFYDLTSNRFYHFLQGVQDPLYAGPMPNRFVRNPFAKITFNSNRRDNGGVSDVKLIAPLQERLNELDSIELWFAKACIPQPFLNENAFDKPEEAKSALALSANPGEAVGLKVKNGIPIDAAVTWSKPPALSPSHDKMRDRCTQVIEFILGLPQYARGNIGAGGDTATEFALADAALRTRNGRRIKVVEDWISEVGLKVLAIWKEKIDPEAQTNIPRPYAHDNLIVSRASLAFPEPGQTVDEFEDEYAYSYEVVPYSPTENHKLVQLQRLQQFYPVIQGLMGKGIDTQKFVVKLLDLLGLSDVQSDGQAATPAPAPSVAGAQGGGGDTLATGAMPAGAEDVETILPPDARGQASQPVVGNQM